MWVCICVVVYVWVFNVWGGFVMCAYVWVCVGGFCNVCLCVGVYVWLCVCVGV